MKRHLFKPDMKAEAVGPDIQITFTRGKTEICVVISHRAAQKIFLAQKKAAKFITENSGPRGKPLIEVLLPKQ